VIDNPSRTPYHHPMTFAFAFTYAYRPFTGGEAGPAKVGALD
jgi:hypothetical protein